MFQEYAAAYKGKRQLSWSSGLKDLLGVPKSTDKQIAEDLALEIWRLVLIYKARGELLKAFEIDKFDGDNRFDILIEDLARRYVIDYLEKLMRDADLISVGTEYLKQVV